MKIQALFFMFCLCCSCLFAQEEIADIPKKSYQTNRIQGKAPQIDGVLDDEVWKTVEWGGGDFVERCQMEELFVRRGRSPC